MYKKINSRRNFIKKSVVIPSIIILPRHVLGGKNYTSPSDKLDIASVGVGGRGRANWNPVLETENIVAMCDVDDKTAKKGYDRIIEVNPTVKKYKEYCELV